MILDRFRDWICRQMQLVTREEYRTLLDDLHRVRLAKREQSDRIAGYVDTVMQLGRGLEAEKAKLVRERALTRRLEEARASAESEVLQLRAHIKRLNSLKYGPSWPSPPRDPVTGRYVRRA
jgi:hypothetical protein